MGVLADGEGVRCVECGGSCTIGEGDETLNCPSCEGNGVVHPSKKELEETPNEAYELVRFILWSRERGYTPLDWLAQPYLFDLAYQSVAGYLFGELEDRRKKLRDGGKR